MAKNNTLWLIIAIVIVIVVIIVIVVCVGCPPPPPEKYAMLASTRTATTDLVDGNGDFWFDLVLTYRTLLEHGFEKENIFVLYGYGTDYPSSFVQYSSDLTASGLGKITDIPLINNIHGDKANLCNVLCCLATGHPAEINAKVCSCPSQGNQGVGDFKCSTYDLPHLRSNDFLFTWIRGHGFSSSAQTEMTFDNGAYITDHEIKDLLSDLEPDRRVLIFETCDSAGWLNSTKGPKTAVLVSSGGPGATVFGKETSHITSYSEVSDDGSQSDQIPHGRFTHWLNSAISQADLEGNPVDSDTDGNSMVSIDEGFVSLQQEITKENTSTDSKYGGVMHPHISTDPDVAPCVFLGLPMPGDETEIFSRDHVAANAMMQMQNFAVVNPGSPDLWVKREAGCAEGPQSVKRLQDNHLCVRVWNIGCADPGPVTVKFFLAEECDHPVETNEIATAEISSLPLGNSAVLETTWKKDEIPSVGTYCLIARLSADGDPPRRNAWPESDDNRVYIPVEVDD